MPIQGGRFLEDEASGGKFLDEEEDGPGRVRDLASRLGASTAEAGTMTIKGAARGNEIRKAGSTSSNLQALARQAAMEMEGGEVDLMTQARSAGQEAFKQIPDRLEESTLYQFGQEAGQGAKEFYKPNPAFNEDFVSKVATGLGSTVPVIALSPFGPAVAGASYGLQAGESAAEEAIAMGKPDASDEAFLLNAGLGALTESVLGVPARVLKIARQARGAGVPAKEFGKGFKRQLAEAVGIGYVREFIQEGTEQFGGNLIARELYDPDRPLSKDVWESALVGGVLGGALGGVANAAGQIDARRTKPATDATTAPSAAPLPETPTAETTEAVADNVGILMPLTADALMETEIEFADLDVEEIGKLPEGVKKTESGSVIVPPEPAPEPRWDRGEKRIEDYVEEPANEVVVTAAELAQPVQGGKFLEETAPKPENSISFPEGSIPLNEPAEPQSGNLPDPNIGRTWDSPKGKKTVEKTDNIGAGNYYIVKNEEGLEWVVTAKDLEETIKRDAYELTPEFAEKRSRMKEQQKQLMEEEAKAKEQLAKDDAEIAEFTTGKSPLEAGRIKKDLYAIQPGSRLTRKKTIENRVEAGYRVVVERGERRLKKENGWWDEKVATKAGMDYAEYLSRKLDIQPEPAPAPDPKPEPTPTPAPASKPEPAPKPPVIEPATAPPSDYGSKNKFVSKDRAEEVRRKLREKLNQLSAGIDPEMLMLGSELAVFHVEAGARKFADFSKAMIADLGDKAKPYLKAWYAAARNWPEFDNAGMDSEDQIRQFEERTNEAGTGIRSEDKGRGPRNRGKTPLSTTTGGKDVEGGVPETLPDTGSPQDPKRDSKRPVVKGVESGGEDAGGIRGGASDDGTGADTTQRGDGTDLAGPAHSPGRENYFMSDPAALVGGGPKARFRKNQAAILALDRIVSENRDPTPQELDDLAAYTGWGAFGQDLFNGSWEAPRPKSGWDAEDKWLREHLGEQDWKAAQTSIINAHYTDPPTVKAMWGMLEKMGFTGGRVLEPSVGIGNFFSLMPRMLEKVSKLTGIELDPTTGRIAQLLHPQSNISIKGYQDSKTADNFYDLVIGNWPFANLKPADRRYNHLDASLHDYFFVKALDQVRPGGIVMGITSSGTMDKKSATIRRWLASRAELVASFRLPSGSFDEYAGTSVVTDIIILKKRESKIEDPKEAWIDSLPDPTNQFFYNGYYHKNSEHILGKIGFGSGTTFGRAGMIVTAPPDYRKQLADLPNRVPEGVFTPWTAPKREVRYIGGGSTVERQLAVIEKGGELYQVQGEQLAIADDLKSWKLKDDRKNKARLAEAKAVMHIRDLFDAMMTAYRLGNETEPARVKLREAYNKFREEYGPIRDSRMVYYMGALGDPSASSLMNLEDENGRPRAILDRDILRPKAPNAAGSIEDAYALQRNRSLAFSLDEVAEMARMPVEEVKKRLLELDQIFQTPQGTWEARDEYLAGNVRRKLREAEDAQTQGMDMGPNIEALKKIIPRDTPYFDIEVRMGANWITENDYQWFFSELLKTTPDKVEIRKGSTGWDVKVLDSKARYSSEANTQWGVPDLSINQIFTASMNGTSVKVWEEKEDGKFVNEEKTRQANGKIESIREEFQKWIWADPDRVARLGTEYNEANNAIVPPTRDGSHLRLEGLALTIGGDAPFNFRKHQADAVWRFVQDGKGVGAHEVGTGKTFTIAGLVMEGRRLGVFRKPIIFAHNANSSSVMADMQRAYPSGKFLYLDSLSPKERNSRLRQIALDDWDAVIVPHSLIDRFTLRKETMLEIVQDQIKALEDEIKAALDELGITNEINLNDIDDVTKKLGRMAGAHTAKELVKARLRIIERIERKAQENTKEDAVFFEDLGLDTVIVDEAHVFKKIALATRKQIRGLNKQESGSGFSLSLITDYLKRRNSGKGVFLFTGTPVTNTLNEVYNMMQYVMSTDMKDAGITSFDDWFNLFADSVTDVELNAAGTYEAVDRLRAFINIPELARLAGRYFDVVLAKNMPEFKPRESDDGITEKPEGRPRKAVVPVTLEMSPQQKAHLETIRKRYISWQEMDGKERRVAMLEGKDTPLQLDTEASLSALDYRLVDKNAPDDPNSKINAAVKNIVKYFDEHPKSTQMVFLEQGSNDFVDREKKVKDESGKTQLDSDGNPLVEKNRIEKFNVVRDLVAKLERNGINPQEVAVFANMKLLPASSIPNDPLRRVQKISTTTTKEDLAAMMREGKIRVAIGGTETMGTGVNAQTWLRAMHHLDAPWMPGSLEQRNGRGWRQGNKWNTVYELRYFTEGGGDGKRWQVLLNKVRFIARFTEMLINGGEGNRVLEGDGADTSESGTIQDFQSSFSQAAGDPRQMLRAQLEKQVRKLKTKRENHGKAVQDAAREISKLKSDIEYTTRTVAALERDLEEFRKLDGLPFQISIEGKSYTSRADAEKALDATPIPIQKVKIGQFGGFALYIEQRWSTVEMTVHGPSGNTHLLGAKSVASLEGTLRGMGRRAGNLRKDIDSKKSAIESLSELLKKPFVRQSELDGRVKALDQIDAEIRVSPFHAPAWLRNTTPQGSLIYTRDASGELVARDVAAHRWDEKNWWILYEAEEGKLRPIAYDEALDETGSRIFEDRPFEVPPNTSQKVDSKEPGEPAINLPPPPDDIISKLEGAKIKPGGETQSTLIPGFDPATFRAVWNTSIDIAIGLVKAGRALKEAIDAAVNYIRSQTEEDFDEEAVRQELTRAVRPAPQLEPPQNKQKVSTALGWIADPEFIYRRQTEEWRKEASKRLLDAFDGDMEEAFRFIQFPDQMSGLDPSSQSVAAALIANEAARRQYSSKNPVDARRWERLATEAIRFAKGLGSTAGQHLQAQKQTADILGEAAAADAYREMIEEKQKQKLEGRIPENDIIQIIKIRLAGAGETAADNIKGAIDKAVGMVNSGSLRARYERASAKSILALLRSRLGPGKPKAILEDFYKRLTKSIGDQMSKDMPAQARKPQTIDDIQQGITDFLANKDKYESVKARVLEEMADLIEANPDLEDMIDVALQALSDKQAGKALKIGMDELGTTFRELIRQSAKSQEDHRIAMFKRILDHPALQGISRDEALEITNTLNQAWQKERLKAFQGSFKAAMKALAMKADDKAKVISAAPRIVQEANAGLLTVEAFRNAIAPLYGLKAFSADMAKRIYDAAQKAQKRPEGSQRDEAFRDIFDMIKKEAGVTAAEMIGSWWYSSVLAGFGTQGRNILGNSLNLADNFAAFSLREPAAIPQLIGGLLRGFRMNASGEFGAILKRGAPASRLNSDLKAASHALEILKDDEAAWKRFFANGRFVSRFMLAVDSFFYDAAVEVQATFDAYREGKSIGNLTRAQLNEHIFKRLNITEAERQAARVQAQEEIDQGKTDARDLDRRANEILRQKRPPEIIESAAQFGLYATLNNTPRGILGTIANSVIGWRKKHPILTPLVPFVRISANVGNMLLDHSPVGLARMFLGRPTDMVTGLPRLGAEPLTLEEWQQLRAKVIISHAALIGIAALAAAHADDDDPFFSVTGTFRALPPQKRRQLEEQGLRRYSIKIGGKSFDYRQSPLAAMFAIIGNYMDGIKYGALDQKELDIQTATALAGGYAVILDQNFLSGIASFLGGGTEVGKTASPDAAVRFIARTVGGVVPQFTKELDSMVNPTVQQSKQFWDYFQQELPVARWAIDRPLKNVLGEDVQRPRYPWSWLVASENQDRIWSALAEKARQGVFLPSPSSAATVTTNGKREKMSDEQFQRYQASTGRAYKEWFQTPGNLERFKRMTPAQAQRLFDTTFSTLRQGAQSRVGR